MLQPGGSKHAPGRSRGGEPDRDPGGGARGGGGGLPHHRAQSWSPYRRVCWGESAGIRQVVKKDHINTSKVFLI